MDEQKYMREVAFLEDISGKRSFLVSSEGKFYYFDQNGKTIEVNENMLAAAIEKHDYEVVAEEEHQDGQG